MQVRWVLLTELLLLGVALWPALSVVVVIRMWSRCKSSGLHYYRQEKRLIDESISQKLESCKVG